MLPGATGGAEEELPPEGGGEEEAVEDQLSDLWQRVSVRLSGQAGGHGGDLQVRLAVMGETSRSGWESLGGPLGQAGGHRTILTNGLVIQGLFTLYEMCYIDRI